LLPQFSSVANSTGIPESANRLALSALAFAVLCIAAALGTTNLVRTALHNLDAYAGWWEIILFLAIAATAMLLLPAIQAFQLSKASIAALVDSDLVTTRIANAESREQAWITFGWGAFALLVLGFVCFVLMNDAAVGRTFFLLPLMQAKWWLVTKKFFTVNMFTCIVAEFLVLIWGLIVALARSIPGRAGRPIRALAILYCDMFRGLPGIVTLYLIGFGIPTSGLPDLIIPHIYELFVDTSGMTALQLKDATRLPVIWWCILALTLTYGAYVAEVYRAGIESIHWSQVSAARSLGLSHMQTMRYVVVPQAVRRIMAPLLNDFIGLQKDTALVQVVGLIDSFNQSKTIASNAFNLSAVTVVAILFVLVTIPQARFVDRLMERDAARMRSGG
jgi:polar amino acid transport system permease protein